MEAIKTSSSSSTYLSLISTRPPSKPPLFHRPFNPQPTNSSISRGKLRVLSSSSSEISTTTVVEAADKFDWFSRWYPVAPVCDLDKRVPHAKKVLGVDIVVWWDKNEEKWNVFDDKCPHRLAPLSEGRIDQWGRLQCVYHGWCFSGDGSCNFIPQAPTDGPLLHSSKKACASPYPSLEQNQIVWFWPNLDSEYKDIATKGKPPYIAELDDPSYTSSMGMREIPYGYEILIENLMDPSHVPYAHYGLMKVPEAESRDKGDREGGRPLEINVKKLDVNGFHAKQEKGDAIFLAPCLFYAVPEWASSGESASPDLKENEKQRRQRRLLFIFMCVPVSPGNSRLIWASSRNFALWIDKLVPRWIYHLVQNLLLDSDMYLLHLEEHKIYEAGPANWQKACFVPTKADALVVAFRMWMRKYSGGEVDWGTKLNQALPPTPPKEQLMDRYRSHVMNCSSCGNAVKGFKALELALQVIPVGLIGVVAAAKQGVMSVAGKTAVVSMAVLCFASSKWLSHFIYKNFYFHDYNHSLK